MAHAPEIPQAALQSIARQIGERLTPPGMATLSAGQPLEITESFPVFMLGLDAVRQRPDNLRNVALQTGVWQHQLRHGVAAMEIARSIEPGAAGAQWQLQEVVTSPSAGRIDEAITWIDQNVPEDAIANLLVVPAFYLSAFWLKLPERDDVIIFDMPEGLGGLRLFERYSAKDFIQALAGARAAEFPPGP